ncbi:lytic polysaccharide monooxygenase [Aquimarina hainanensis]|uniref:Lytic polysaccharide monooxygenase n=1 Tax=Aquimarina hainanensis TaxID=1578017 RepID=A0ABW5N905_9FLAO|nr:lytic polysaccharide monooxygenase [Aquimarina sp. TRL1]QKX03598.1 T9SS type A sorting domain-containing protein [Aquimarina sp. TRL1]BBQ04068.1 chitinase [Aquimarina hainanensis]
MFKTTNSARISTINCSWRQLICTFLFLSVILPVLPHGTVTYPPSRIWTCFQEDPESPDSAACIAAVASHGTQPLYDWSEINQANANGDHRRYVKDGNLASGGRPDKYGGMDQVRSDWLSTLVSPGPFTVTWTNHAPHATAYYEVYITKESWSPGQPLTWDSLELLVRTPPSGPERIVNIPVTLPTRTGKHVIYSVWQRSDSAEAFYSTSDIHFDGGDTDTQAPSIPTNLRASNATQTTVDLAWDAATDNIGVSGYDVYRANTHVATVTDTSYQVTGLAANTEYFFRVKARDAAGNLSDFSSSAKATTLQDTGGGSCSGISRYAAGTSYNRGQEVQHAGGKYKCTVAGWCSSASAWAYAPGTGTYWRQAWTKTGDCNGGSSDTQAPSVPANLSTSNITQTTIDLSWGAATDDTGVIGYDVYQGSTVLSTVSGTSYQVTGLAGSTTYSFRVKAKDAAGNQSDFSNTATATTLTDTGGGSCAGVSQYVAGTSYTSGEEVKNAGGKYKCTIAGWCSSAAAWAYAPGTGSYWQQAWTKTGDCNSNALYALFPTVTQGIVNFSVADKNAESIRINLYDITGKLMNSQIYQGNQKSIAQDLSTLKKGLYIYRIYIDGKVYVERILKK